MRPYRRVLERACALLLGCVFVSLPAYASSGGSSAYAGHQVIAGDFNGDGLADFILQPVPGYQGSAEFLAYANGNFGPPVAKWPDASKGTDWNAAAHDIVVGDFNGDGRDDLLLQGIAGHQSRLFLASAQGTFDAMSATLPAALDGLGTAQAQHRLIVGDFNGDGRDDLLLQANSFVGTSGIALAGPNGTFTTLASHWNNGTLNLGWSADRVALSAGDFRGDRHAELLVRSRDAAGTGENCCEIVKLNQAEQPGAIVQGWNVAYLGVPWDPATETVVTGDLNGDGRADILVQPDAPGGTVYVLLANAKGEFTRIADQWPSQQGGTDWSAESYQLVIDKAGPGKGGSLLMIPKEAGLAYQRAEFNAAGALVGVTTVTSPPADALDPTASGGGATSSLSPSSVNLAVQSASTNTSGDSTGTLPGSGAVSGGAASYSIPIAVPPGRAGMAPSLSLTYSSTGGDGHEGVGWSLGGLSAIYRCPATQASDDYTAGVSFASTDHFCLDGQKLMLASGTYGAANSVYHVEVNGFATVTAQGNVGTGSGYFTVVTPDGRTLTYGENGNAELLNGSTIFSWSLYRDQDADGNIIQYDYNKSGGENWLTKIEYTEGNGGAGTTRTVQFGWETRASAGAADITHYLDGMTLQTTRLLTSITTAVGSQDERSYALSYSISSATQRPLLSAAQECGWDPQTGAQHCLPATTFSYQGDHALSYVHLSAATVSAMGLIDNTLATKQDPQCSISSYGGWQARDVDGDGREDLYEAFGSAGADTDPGAGVTDVIQYAKPGGGYTTAQSIGIAAPSGHSWYQVSDPIDFNLDGRTDILIQDWNGTTSDSLKVLYTTASAPRAFQEYNTGITLPSDTIQATPYVADVNGDGKPDIVVSLVLGTSVTTITGYEWQLYLASGTGTSTTWSLKQTLTTSTGAVYSHVLDYDADGRQDLLVRYQGDSYYTLLRSTRSSAGAITLVPHTTNIPYIQASEPDNPALPVPITVADLNGDSLPDVVQAQQTSSGTWDWYAYLNQGLSSGQFAPVNGSGDTGLAVATTTYSGTGTTYPMFSFVKILHDPDGRDDLILPTARTYITPILSTDNCIHGTDKCNPGTPVTIPNCGTYDSYRQDFSPQAFDGYDWTLYRTNVNASGIPSFSSDGVVAQNLTAGPFMIDFDSSDSNPDGLTDILGVNAALMGPKTIEAYQLSFAGGGTGDPSPDLLSSVVNGYGAETSFSYAPLTDQAVYTDTATSSYPNMIFASPMQVAASMSQSNPTGGLNTDDYTYANAAYNVEGRGFLGFGKVTDADTAAGTVTQTDRDQLFPLIGRVTQQTTWTTANQGSTTEWLAQQTNSWSDKTVESHRLVYDASQTDTGKDPTDGYSEIKSTTQTQGSVDDCGNAATSTNSVDDAVASSSTSSSDTYNYQGPEACEQDTLSNDDTTTTVTYKSAPTTSSTLEVTTAYTYYTDLRVKTKTVTTTGLTRKWTYVYNTYGDLTSAEETANGASRTTTSDYGAYSGYFAGSITNALGQTSTFSYDTGTGEKLSVSDPNDITANFTYDAFGRSTGGDAPGASPVNLSYIAASAVAAGASCPNHAEYATERTQAGYPTVYTCYDALGDKLRTATQGFASGSWVYQDASYDDLGRVATQSQPYYPGDTAYDQLFTNYDVLNRPHEVDKPGGLVITMSYAGLQTNYTATDGSTGTVHTYSHSDDGLGSTPRLAEVIDATNHTALYRYDAGGNLIRAVDPLGNTIAATYDGFGDKLTLSDPDKGDWSYGYDGFGDLTSVTNARGQQITYKYDALGRKTQETDPADNRVANYAYDTAAHGVGALASESVTVNGTLSYARQYAYDPDGRPAGTETTAGGVSYLGSVGYGPDGHVLSRTYPAMNGNPDQAPVVQITVSPGSYVLPNTAVTLDGSGTSDADGPAPLTYQWSEVSGPDNVTIGSADTDIAGATLDQLGTYVFRLTANDGLEDGSASVTIVVENPPPAPASAPAVSPNPSYSGGYTVSWSAQSGVTGYVLQESGDGGSTWSEVYSGAGTSWGASGKAAGSYLYRLESCNPVGCGAASETASETVSVPASGAAPSFSPSPSYSGGYGVSWSAITGADSYDLQQSVNGGAWSSVASGTTGRSWSAGGEAAGSYAYRVRGCDAVGCGSWSASASETVTVPAAPATPTLSVNPSYTGSYTVSWATVTGASSYQLQESANGGSSWSEVYAGAGTSWGASGKTSGSYLYRVRACDAVGCGGWSGSVTEQVVAPAAGTTPALSPNPSYTGAYAVSWATVTRATSYNLQESANGGAWSQVYSGAGTSWSASGKASGGYAYQVRGCDAVGCGAWSASASETVTVQGAPGASPNPSYTGSYTVSWSSVSGASSYKLQESANGGAWSQVYSGAGTSWGASGKAAESYAYRVQACNASSCGGWSSAGSETVTVPAGASAPTPSTTTSYTGGYTVSWSAVTGASSYELQESVNGGAWSTISTGSPRSWSASGKAAGGYRYRVRGCSAVGCGSWSGASATVTVKVPATLAAPSFSTNPSYTGSYTVSWSSTTGATSYQLQQSANGGSWSQVYSGAGTSWGASGEASGGYAYRARACDAVGCGSWSASATETVVLPPTGAPSVSPGAQTVTMGSSYTLSWNAVASATSYSLKTDGGTPSSLGNVTSITRTAPSKPQGYTVTYQVEACNAAGCGPWSNTADVNVVPNTTCYHPPCLAAVTGGPQLAGGSARPTTLAPATATAPSVPALTVDYSYNTQGYVYRATRASDGTVYATITTMDAYGHVTAASEQGGVSLTRGYDQATGLALSTEADNTSGTALVKLAYAFDEFGNLATRSDALNNSSESEGYDDLNRLISSKLTVAGSSVTTTYGYDPAGDLTSRSDRGTYTYGGAGPHQVTAISDGSTFAYDADGEMTNDDGTTLTWAAFGKAVQVKTAAGTTLGLAYGPDEGRYQKTVSTSGGASETVLYLGAAEVLTLGSSVGLVNAAGSLVRAMSYGPYGKRRTAGWAAPMSQDTAWTIDTTETDRGYTGQESLDSVGLDDYNARLYDPALGRFLSTDPLISHPGSTQSINPYSYVENNPLN